MKVFVHNYRAMSMANGEYVPRVSHDIEFDDALRMIHPDAAWMWDRDEYELTSGPQLECVALWDAGSDGNLGCIVDSNAETNGSRYVFNGQRWARG